MSRVLFGEEGEEGLFVDEGGGGLGVDEGEVDVVELRETAGFGGGADF